MRACVQETNTFAVACGCVLSSEQDMLLTGESNELHKPSTDSAEAEDMLKGITHSIL